VNILVMTSTIGSFNSVRPEAEIYISLASRGHNITIITQSDTPYANRFKECGIRVVDGSYKKKISPALIKTARSIIKDSSIEILFAANSKAISNAIVASMFSGVKLITYRGTTGGLYRYDPSAYLNALNPRVDGVVAVSKAVQKRVQQQIISQKTRVANIYKGHKIEWYQSEALNLEEFGIKKGNFSIAFVANMRPHKGLAVVLEACKSLAKHEDLHLIVVGDGALSYKDLVEQSGMRERIHLAGFRSDAPSIVASCDLLLQASTRKEGLSRVILEALASGVVVVASDIDGNKEIITHEVNGLVVEKGDAKALADAISRLYNDRGLLGDLKKNAGDVFINKMSHKASVDGFEAFFASFLEGKS